MVSEVATAIIIVIVIIAVGFGFYVGSEHDAMVEDDVLANAFINLLIRPAPIDASNLEAGYGAGLYVHSNQEADGNDTFVTAMRLHESMKEKDEDALRGVKIEKVNQKEKDIEYSMLASEASICVVPGLVAG